MIEVLDKYSMYIVNKKGEILNNMGSHTSVKAAINFFKNHKERVLNEL